MQVNNLATAQPAFNAELGSSLSAYTSAPTPFTSEKHAASLSMAGILIMNNSFCHGSISQIQKCLSLVSACRIILNEFNSSLFANATVSTATSALQDFSKRLPKCVNTGLVINGEIVAVNEGSIKSRRSLLGRALHDIINVSFSPSLPLSLSLPISLDSFLTSRLDEQHIRIRRCLLFLDSSGSHKCVW